MGAVSDVWNAEYQAGRYVGEPPLAFAGEILAELDKRPKLRAGRGLYVGCGNGRNYTALAKTGLDIIGLDVSEVGLGQIAAREPQMSDKLVCGDFLGYGGRFDYIIAIQSFQHGTRSRAEGYLRHASQMLERGGLLFVRVNCSDTEVLYPYHIVEEGNGGFTVRYEGGPKKGLCIRFFSKNGLIRATHGAGLHMVRAPRKVTVSRTGRRGSWSQWEMILAPGRDGNLGFARHGGPLRCDV